MENLAAGSAGDLLTIGEFSARSGLTQKMLRSYASAGLLVPAAVDRWTGYRYYAPDQVRQAKLIRLLRQASVPLKEIAEFLSRPTAAHLRRWEQALDTEAEGRRDALAEFREQYGAGLITEPAPVTWATATVVGTRENADQDASLACPPLFAVADGLGGTRRGQVASRLVLDTLQSALTAAASVEALVEATRQASQAVWRREETDPELDGMGTTLTAALVLEPHSAPRLAIVHIGDSRAYVCTDGQLTRLTRDHSVVQGLIDAGRVKADRWRQHPQRALLTRAIGGTSAVVEPDISLPAPYSSGCRLLLCTDGITATVPDPSIETILRTTPDPSQAAQSLIDLSRRNAGTDDATVIIVDLPPSADPPCPRTPD